MKRRALTLFLCLTLLLSLAIPGTTAFADETGSETPSSGMELNKTAVRNNDGTYTITLEAYATGSKVITTEKKDIPTDIILVLDQSGSMDETFSNVTADSWTSYGKQSNSTNYGRRMNASNGTKNLYYKLPDGDYVGVSVERYTDTLQSYEIFNGTNSQCYNKGNLYVSTQEGYKKVDVDYKWGYPLKYTYTYEMSAGSVTEESEGRNGNPPFTLYELRTSNVYRYEYFYTIDGTKTVIGAVSEGANTVFDTEFYQKATTTTSVTKLSALKSAVSTFVKAVNEKAKGPDGVSGTSDDVNHRIAMVGFASGSYYNGYNYNYSNTEVFVGSKEYRYGTAAQGQYANAFQDMNTSAGVSNINASINALDADGGTLTNLGLEMANGIFGKNPLKTDEQRNRVVIVFTDGIPGWSGYDSTVAGSAVSQASTAKTTYGATVYTIGIFAGADATSAGSTDRNSTDADKGNYFLQQVSSNNGTPQTPSYYLSAADAGTLSNIFQQISDQIESGGSSSTLTEESVVKDIVSEQFTLPDGATASSITLETYKYNGGDQKAASSWTKNADAMGAAATVNGDQVSVTGFNFSENYVGTVTENGTVTYRGNKLVIKFNVKEKEGLLGGNAIPTNASAGVYEKSDSADPVIRFPQPTVDVPISNVTVTAEDKNVYLKGTVTAADLQTGATVKVGDVELDLSNAADTEKPYGLEKWQVAYVDIAVKILNADGTEVTGDYENLTADTTYTVQVTVSPRNEGSVKAKSGNAKGSINVFTPTLTYKDGEAYYGKTVTNDFSGNLVSEKWMHNGEEAVASSMIGDKPELNIIYTAEPSKLNNNTYTKQDVPVAAQVFIGNDLVNEYTTFGHQVCSPECGWVNATESGNPAFKIHIKTCTLKITKTGGAAGETYVFDVYKDNQKYSEVTVSGNGTETLVELPVGTYTIEENTGWSWRYTANNGSAATLSAQNPNGTITCTNTKNVNTWLNGFSAVARNIFGKAN